jgi:hypothetical protein
VRSATGESRRVDRSGAIGIACQKERDAGPAKGVETVVRVLVWSLLAQDNILCCLSHAMSTMLCAILAKNNGWCYFTQ